MHGSTPAAWTAVTICLIGFTVGAIGMIIGPSWVVFGVGVALVLVGAPVGKVLSLAGLGAKTQH